MTTFNGTTRMPSSAIHYRATGSHAKVPPIRQRASLQAKTKDHSFLYTFLPKSWSHRLLLIGALSLIAIYIIGTYGMALWSHITDPGTFGPAHGQVVYMTVGTDDKPSTITSLNTGGQVLIMVIRQGDLSKSSIILGPDLNKMGFHDPSNANVALHVNGQIIYVDVLATTYTLPFQRDHYSFTLTGNGDGQFK